MLEALLTCFTYGFWRGCFLGGFASIVCNGCRWAIYALSIVVD